MAEPIVIVHGWSDTSRSFGKLAAFIRENFGAPPVVIRLADWISMRNPVTFEDLAYAMNEAWIKMGLPSSPRSTNIVVHSTGALVVRQWMVNYHKADTVPIKRFLMLAPANFGSHLAHKGRSFIGRAIKGWGQPKFETGEQILRGLELASPYTYSLAARDLFSTDRWYGKDRILATVLVGNTGYSGVEAIANEVGSDGTVRIATANLNCARLTATLDEKQQVVGNVVLEESRGSIAFGIVDRENHSTLVFKDNGPRTQHAKELIARALKVTDADYADTGSAFPWQNEITDKDPGVLERADRRQTTVVRVKDNFSQDVKDYFVEFYRKSGADRLFEAKLYQKVVDSVHAYEANPAYRALNLDIAELAALAEAEDAKGKSTTLIYLSILANPIYAPPNELVGYVPLSSNDVSGMRFSPGTASEFFRAHRTLLVDLTIRRMVHETVFTVT